MKLALLDLTRFLAVVLAAVAAGMRLTCDRLEADWGDGNLNDTRARMR